MSLLWISIIALIVIFLLRFGYYWREVFFLKDLNKTYGIFFHEYAKLPKKDIHILDPNQPALKAITKLRKRKSHYIGLVKKAGFYDNTGLVTHENIGFQQYRVDHKVADLIDDTNPKYIRSVMESFDNVIGYFEDRARESLDPFYWIQAILNSPKTIVNMIVDIIKHAITGK